MPNELDIRHVSENRVLMDERAVVDYYLGPPDRGVSTVAHELRISKARVSAILHCAGVMRPAGVRGKTKPAGVYAINGGQALRAARRAVPLSQDELASRVGTVQATVSGLETRFGYAVSEEQAYRFAAALDRPFGEFFTTARPAARLLDTESSSQVPRTKRAEVRAAETHAEAHGWWTTKQAADYVKVTERTLHAYQERGYVAAVDERQFGTLPFKFWDPEAVKRFASERFHSTDGRVQRFYDERAVFRHELVRGMSLEDATRAAERAPERKKAHGRVRIGTGRPPASDRERWATRMAELEAELEARGERETQEGLRRLVALEDWEEHPEAWPRDRWPADAHDTESLSRDEYRGAAARIRHALDRLS